MLQYWECTIHLYNHQCDLPMKYNMRRSCFQSLFAKWIFLFNFCCIDCHWTCKKKTKCQWSLRLICEFFSTAKLWIWKQLKVESISLWKRVWPFIWTNLNPIHPWLLSAKFGWNWTSESGVVNVFFRYNLPLKMGVVLHLNKVESPTPKDALCQDGLKIDQWIWRRRFFECQQFIFTTSIISPSKKGVAPHLYKLEFPLPNDVLYQIWNLVEIDPVVLEKKILECW